MNLAMVQPWCSIGSDGSALAVEGPLRARASASAELRHASRASWANTSATAGYCGSKTPCAR